METKKETELRERREKVERGRARKIRKTQTAMEQVSIVQGCKDDEYDIESALLAIEGLAQDSKQNAKKMHMKSNIKSSGKEVRHASSGDSRSTNLEKMSANASSLAMSRLAHEGGAAVRCSSWADEDIQMHLKELLFGGKLLKNVVLDTANVKEMGLEERIVGPMDSGKVLPEQVRYNLAVQEGEKLLYRPSLSYTYCTDRKGVDI